MKNTVQSALVFHYYSTLRLDNNILMKTKGINSPGFHFFGLRLFSVIRFKPPGIPNHVVNSKLCLPSQGAPGIAGVGISGYNIAGSPFHDFVCRFCTWYD
jgi:hypothetical protein